MTRMTITTAPPKPRAARRRRHDARRSAGLELPNPVFTASGCAAAGRELDQFVDVAELGAVVTKSIMLRAALRPRRRRGWPRRRAACSTRSACRARASTPSSTRDLAWLAERGARAVVSIAGQQRRGVRASSRRGCAAPSGVAAVEVNISCPNVEARGQVFACDPLAAAEVIARGAPQHRARACRCSPSSRRTSPTSSRSRGRASPPAPTACR